MRFVVAKLEDGAFAVLSLDSSYGKPKQYTVKRNGYKFLCNCEDFAKHSDEINYACKHIIATFIALTKMDEFRAPAGVYVELKNGKKWEEIKLY